MSDNLKMRVNGPVFHQPNIVQAKLEFNGKAYQVLFPTDSYQELIKDGFFLTDGVCVDMAGEFNITKQFQTKD